MATLSPTQKLGVYRFDTNENKALGKGSFAMTFLGRNTLRRQRVVGKRLIFDKTVPLDIITKEARMMRKVQGHENILKILDCYKYYTLKHIQVSHHFIVSF